MDDQGWDLSDFLTRYTTNSNRFSSPLKTNDISNGSLDSEQSPQIRQILSNEEEFCNKENLEHRLQFLNQELTVLGFPSIFAQKHSSKYHKDVNENFDVTKLVNCTYELLRRQQRQVKAKDELEARQIRSDTDNEYLMQNQVRLKQDLENLKREAALLLCREKDQIDKCRVLQQDLKTEREEKRKMRAEIDHLKKQFYHESKRTEKEITRLKEKVHQVLNDKSQERKIGIDILNSLQRADGKRSTWKTSAKKKHEEEMYKMVISNFEHKEKSLLTENLLMKDLLLELQNMLTSAVDTSLNDINEEESSKQFQMPFGLVKHDIEERLKLLVTSLKEKRLPHKPEPSFEPRSVEEESFTTKEQRQHNAELENKLQQYKAIISGQEKIIQSMKDGYSIEAFEKVLKTFGSEEVEDKSEQRESFLKEQERKFNEERKQFTDYVLKISKEKEEFEKERVEFYMHCLSTPVMKRDKKLQKVYPTATGHLQTVTPAFSPAPRNSTTKLKTPSTAELYKFMSLSYDSGIARNPEKGASFDGSFVQYDAIDGSSREGSPSSRKLQEHADKIRKAVEEHHKSLQDEG